MTTYFVGGGFDCWRPSLAGCSDSAAGINVSNANGAYADAFLRDPATTARTTATTLWFHSYFNGQNYQFSDKVVLELRSADDTPRVRLRMQATGPQGYFLEWFDGAAWHSTDIATPGPAIVDDVDIKVVVGVAGYIGWYVGKVLAAELSGIDTSSMGAISYVRAYGRNDYYGNGMYEQTIIASYNTIGHVVKRRQPNANGPEQAWAGSYVSIGKGNTDDSTAITSNLAGDVSTFAAGPLDPLAPGSVIKCLAIGTRARGSGDAPTRVATVVTGGDAAEHVGPAFVPAGGYGPVVSCYDLDPSTNAPWATIDAVNGNFGVKAVA